MGDDINVKLMPVLYTEDQVLSAIKLLAVEVNSHIERYKGLNPGIDLHLVAVLEGGTKFASLLSSHLKFKFTTDAIQTAKYYDDSDPTKPCELRIEDIEPDIVEKTIIGRTILLLDDIYDSGQTAHTLADRYLELGAVDVFIVTMLWKRGVKTHSCAAL